MKKTVAFGYVSGWFHGAKGSPPFHAYARVGERVFHFMDDGVIHELSFADAQKELLNRPPTTISEEASAADRKRIRRGDNPTTFETIFDMPESAMSDLLRYYRDRKAGTATIGNVITKPPYDVGGFGQMNENNVPIENCITFALSFTQSHWSRDYPGMQKVREAANVTQLPGGDIINGATIPQLMMTSTPLAVVVIGKDALEPGYRPEIDMLEQLRILRKQRLTPADIRIEQEWTNRPSVTLPVGQ